MKSVQYNWYNSSVIEISSRTERRGKIIYLTVKQQPKLDKEEISSLKELSHTAKNLYNEALYSIRQHFFNTNEYLNYYENYRVLKNSDNYRLLNSNMAQQILKEADGSFRSFFGLLRLKNEGKYKEKVKIPKYLDKDGYTTLVIGFVRLNGNRLIIPYSNRFRKQHRPIEVTVPPQLTDRKIKEIRIIPRCHASYFEFQYTYEADTERISHLSNHKYISLDIGINNLVSAATDDGQSFLIDGRYLKSVSQWFNKENARLQSIHMKQHHCKGKDSKDIKLPYTRKQLLLLDKRNKRINDYMSKTARYIINYCINNGIGNIILGYNRDIQRNSDIGKANNQSFTNIPIGKLKDKLTYLCELYGISLILQEESYTSKASFFDNDEIPVYEKDKSDNSSTSYVFSGSRIKRGLYKTSCGRLINADINGALNIMKKALKSSKADDLRLLSDLCIAGHVDVPVRIRLA